MNNEIPKLSNVKFQLTDEVIQRKWMDVLIKRNRLLAASDWTQLNDSSLPANKRSLWASWRQHVRKIKQKHVRDPDAARDLLATLETQTPDKLSLEPDSHSTKPAVDALVINEEQMHHINHYINTAVNEILSKIISVDDISNMIEQKLSVKIDSLATSISGQSKPALPAPPVVALDIMDQDLSKVKSDLLTKVTDHFDKKMPKINHELIQEAIDYISDVSGTFPLLTIHAKHANLHIGDMARQLFNEKREWLKTVCNLEDTRLGYIVAINQASSKDDLAAILNEISDGH